MPLSIAMKERTGWGAMDPFKMVRNQDYQCNQFNYFSLKMVNACLYEVFHFSLIEKSEGPFYGQF